MAGNLAKPTRGWRIDTAAQKAQAQYGYNPGRSHRRGWGRGEHYVYPDIFGASAANGLSRGVGRAVAPLAVVIGDFLDLSGWKRFTVWYNFNAVIPAGGFFIRAVNFADPAFNNQLNEPTGVNVAAGATNAVYDSQNSNAIWSPYIQFYVQNGDAVATVNFEAVLFVFDYLRA